MTSYITAVDCERKKRVDLLCNETLKKSILLAHKNGCFLRDISFHYGVSSMFIINVIKKHTCFN